MMKKILQTIIGVFVLLAFDSLPGQENKGISSVKVIPGERYPVTRDKCFFFLRKDFLQCATGFHRHQIISIYDRNCGADTLPQT